MDSIACPAAPVNDDARFRQPTPAEQALWSAYTLARDGERPRPPVGSDPDIALAFATGNVLHRDGKLPPVAPPAPAWPRPTFERLVARLRTVADEMAEGGDPVDLQVARILSHVADDCDVFRSATYAEWDARVEQRVRDAERHCETCLASDYAAKL